MDCTISVEKSNEKIRPLLKNPVFYAIMNSHAVDSLNYLNKVLDASLENYRQESRKYIELYNTYLEKKAKDEIIQAPAKPKDPLFICTGGEQNPVDYFYISNMLLDYIKENKEKNPDFFNKLTILYLAGPKLFYYQKLVLTEPTIYHPSFLLFDSNIKFHFCLMEKRLPLHFYFSNYYHDIYLEFPHIELFKPFSWTINNSNEYQRLMPLFAMYLLDKYDFIELRKAHGSQLKIGDKTIFHKVSSFGFFHRAKDKERLLNEINYLMKVTGFGFKNWFYNSVDIFTDEEKNRLYENINNNLNNQEHKELLINAAASDDSNLDKGSKAA